MLGQDAGDRGAPYLPVPFTHALGVRALDVLLDDLFPPAPAQPSPKEALHLLDLAHLDRVLYVERARIGEYETVLGLPARVRRARRAAASSSSSAGAAATAATAAADAPAAAPTTAAAAAVKRTSAGTAVRRQRPQFLL